MNYGKITAKVSDRNMTSSFELPDGSVLRIRGFELRSNERGEVELVLVLPPSGYDLQLVERPTPRGGDD